MPGVTYDHYFKTQIAKAFVDQFTSFSEDKYYLCLSGIDAVTSDARTERNELDVRKNILLSKRIDQNSASLLLPRYDWTEGISMDAISDTVDVLVVVQTNINILRCWTVDVKWICET